MGEVLRAGRADGLAACSIVDFVQVPASGARAQLRRDRFEWQPCTALLGSLYCILHYIPAPFVLQMHCVVATEGGSGRPDPGYGHAGPRSCSGRQAAGLGKLSGAVFAWSDLLAWRRINVRDERTRRRVAPGKTAASQARRNAPAARQGRGKNPRIEREFLRRQDKARRRAQLHIPGKAR